MIDRSSFWRQILGWTAIAVSTAFACLWAWWGANENFHEGWYYAGVWQNLGMMFVQYLSPMLVILLVSALALRWPWLALPLMATCAIAAAGYLGKFRIISAATILIAIPLFLLGVLYHFGRPKPRRWAWRCLVGLPLFTAIASGAYPGWLAMHRYDDGQYGTRLIKGNGLTLVWAPQGPGWPADGVSWYKATGNCAHLSRDGNTLASSPQNVWRLPTVDEAVRSLVLRGNNAGGTWDPAQSRAHFRETPDKDSPLWKVHSKVIYWWTSTEAGATRAYYITNNGYVHLVPKQTAAGYLAYRCVTDAQPR